MTQVLAMTTDNFPGGTILEIPWAPGKKASDKLNTAAELITGAGGGKIARKVAVQAAKMSLAAQMRKLEHGGRLIVMVPESADSPKGENGGRFLIVRSSVEKSEGSEIPTPKDLKTELSTKTEGRVEYLHHHSLGYGGRAVGVNHENNVDSHVAYYAFMSPTHTHVTQFEASIETDDDGNGFTKEELETVAEVVKRSSLSSEDAQMTRDSPSDTAP